MKDTHCAECPYQHKTFVGPEGSRSAQLVIIGEAPGAQEEKTGRPFVGGAGQLLDKLMFSQGLLRQNAYITNVIKCRPDNNEIDTKDAQRAVACCSSRLLDELNSLSNPHVTVPMGNTALHALGFNYSVSNARGFIFPSRWGKIIPTWHPAYVMRQFDEYVTATYDWRKIGRHLKEPSVLQYKENFTLFPTIDGIERWVSDTLIAIEDGRLKIISIDLETTISGHTLKNCIKLIGFGTSREDAFVVPLVNQAGLPVWGNDAEYSSVFRLISRILENSHVTKVFHNALFDIPVLMNHGFKVVGPVYDTMLARFVVYNPSQLSLNYLASIYTDAPPWKLMKGNTDEEYRAYNARDCCILHELVPHLEEDIESNHVRETFDRTMNVILPVAKMMLNGIGIDRKAVKEGAFELRTLQNSLREQLREMSGVLNLNPNSHPQLAKILFEDMGLKSQVHTDSGKLSVSKDVLNRLSLRYPENEFIGVLLQYNEIAKLVSTYSAPPIHRDGRVHAEFKLTLDTGRFAAQNPNVMNIPKGRSKEASQRAKIIRQIYCAPNGRIIIAGDLSQAELYTLAVRAAVREWLTCFENNDDIHKINGAALIGEYDPQYRTFFKNFIFGFNYGSEGSEIEKVAPKELIDRLSIKQMIANFTIRFPELFIYRENILKELQTTHRLRNMYGRVRFYPGEMTKEVIRSGYNYPIQSTVADFVQTRITMLDQELDLQEDKLILQLHDALYLEVAENRQHNAMTVLKQILEYPDTTPSGHVLQYKASLERGYNLAAMEEVA